MPACSAFGCKNRPSKPKRFLGVTFHSFPKDEKRRSEWIRAVFRKDWLPTTNSVLCSEHFEDSMLDRSMTRVQLKPDAVPCIFKSYPSYLQKRLQKNKKKTIANDGVKKESHKKTMKEMVEEIHPMKMRKQKETTLEVNNDVNKETRVKMEKEIDEEIHPISNERLLRELSEMKSGVFPNSDSSNFLENFVEEVGSSNFETQLLQKVSSDICTYDEETNFLSENESAEALKQKLKKLSAKYEILEKHYEESHVLCKLYMKENASLRKVIDNLRQIISVSNDS